MLIPSDVTAPCWVGIPLDTDIAHLADGISGIVELEQMHIEIQNNKVLYCDMREQPESFSASSNREKKEELVLGKRRSGFTAPVQYTLVRGRELKTYHHEKQISQPTAPAAAFQVQDPSSKKCKACAKWRFTQTYR